MFLCAVPPLPSHTTVQKETAYQNIVLFASLYSLNSEHILRMFAIKMSNDRRDLYSSQSATIHWQLLLLLLLMLMLLLQGSGKTKMMIIHVRYDLAHEKRTDTQPHTRFRCALVSASFVRSFVRFQRNNSLHIPFISFVCSPSSMYYFVCLFLFLLLLLLIPFASLCCCCCCCFYHYYCY